jgi:hypothetical protein
VTIYGGEKTFRYDTFSFQVAFDSGNETGFEQRDIYWREGKSEERWVRSFYFDDVVEQHMRAFCKRFAEDQAYRQASIARTTDWAVRDRLFRRNSAPEFWQKSLLVDQLGSVTKVYLFFKKHWKVITSTDDYQSLMQLDSAFQPSRGELDPEIRDAVNLFNEIEGVKTKFSCQGVSRLFEYEGLSILADTPHARLAYISFDSCPASIEHLLQTYAPGIASYELWNKTFQSLGENLRFRQLAREIAQVAKV